MSPKEESEQELVRLAFDVFPDNGDPNRRYRAGKKYLKSLSHGSPFREDLEGWIGVEQLTQEDEFDTDELVNKQARLLIKHRHNDGWEHPYVYIAHIAPVEENEIQKAEPVSAA